MRLFGIRFCFFVFFVLFLWFGILLLKLGFVLRTETSALNQESPELMEIHKDVKEIKAIIKGFCRMS